MSGMNLSANRFLTDHRLVKFVLDIDGQNYELAMSAIIAGSNLTFYTIFKPEQYDHIIYMSSFTPSWKGAKVIFNEMLQQVVSNYNVDLEQYPDLSSFIG